MKTFTLPDLGEGLTDAEIISWHVLEGDRVVADQPLVVVETEKAVVEVPAPWSGTVVRLHASAGDVIEVGAPLADIDSEGDSKDTGAVVGALATEAENATGPEAASDAIQPSTKVRAAPAIRKLARELGLDLGSISGTGPDGAITRKDVEAAIGESVEGYEPLRGVRRTMARNMTHAHAEVATTNVTDEANISPWPDSEDVTMRLVRAMVVACKAEPALNAWFDAKRQSRLLHKTVDLGIAMDIEGGLFVPVLRDAGNRTLNDIRTGLEAMKKDVTERTVPPEELRGQTITLSNFGMIGGRYATLTVLPPQVAILGAGRITEEPRIVGGEIRPSRVLPLSLTFDHRVVMGAEATRFLMCIVKDLEG